MKKIYRKNKQIVKQNKEKNNIIKFSFKQMQKIIVYLKIRKAKKLNNGKIINIIWRQV